MTADNTTIEKKINGRIKKIFDTNFATQTFKKRDLIVVTDEQHPQILKIEFHQDRVDLLGAYFPGDEVEVSINIRGREWVDPNGKSIYFNTFIGWRIRKTANGYIVPTADGSQHVQHNFKLPDAKDVFPDEPGFTGASHNNAFGNEFRGNHSAYKLSVDDDPDNDLPF